MSQTPPQTTNRKTANLIDSGIFLIVVAIAAIILNVILAHPSVPNVRKDLTEDQLYTLSDASKEMVGGLEDKILIKLFISENLQYPDHNLEQRVSDLLAEYEAHSGGNLTFEIIHPETKEDKEDDEPATADADAGETPAEDEPEDDDEAEDGPEGFGIQKIPVGVRGKDEVALRMVYKGMAFLYGDKTETINEIKGTDNLEYEISKRIKQLTTPEEARKTVGFVTGFGGPADNPQFMQSINGAFQNIYGDLIKAQGVDLKTTKTIPDEVDALVLLNPQTVLDDAALYAIDQFIMQGKGVGWFQTSLKPDERMPMLPTRQPVLTGLAPMFEKYGIKMNRDLVLDRKSNIVGLVFTERGLAQVSNPTMPVFTDINETSVLTKDIPTLSFPIASSLQITAEATENEALTKVELVKTEGSAVRRSDITTLSYEQIAEPADDEEKGKFLMAASLQGPMPSYFAGKEKPEAPPASQPASAPEPPAEEKPKKDVAETGARILVVGNGDFMFPNQQTGFGQQYSSLGALFLLNSIDWLVQDEALITIRAKGIPRVLKGVEPEDHLNYQIANIVGVPALFALVGLALFFVRRQRQRDLTL